MKRTCGLLLMSLLLGASPVQGQTADDLTALIDRLVELDSIDLSRDVKFRAGLEPALHAFDAGESGMEVLKNSAQVMGRNKPGAAGWYRTSVVVPEKLGKFAVPREGYKLGVESNVLGGWEIYSYLNGKPVGGSTIAPAAERTWLKGNVMGTANQHPTVWMSNAPIQAKPGDRITVVVLAQALPLGQGSPEGFALRHLRLRFAQSHTFGRLPLYGSVTTGGLHAARERLRTLKGEPLKALQEKLQGPLARLNRVFEAAESGKLDNLTTAMRDAARDIDAALKK